MTLILPRNWCLIFFRDPEAKFTSARMKRVLRGAGLTVVGRKEPYSVRAGDGPIPYVSIDRGSYIESVIRRLVGPRRKHRKLIPGCDTEIRILLSQLVEYFKPAECPVWMDSQEYEALPSSLVVREVRVAIRTPACRVRELTLVTTLLDRRRCGPEVLARRYEKRWGVETNPRHLQETLQMDVLRCETWRVATFRGSIGTARRFCEIARTSCRQIDAWT